MTKGWAWEYVDGPLIFLAYRHTHTHTHFMFVMLIYIMLWRENLQIGRGLCLVLMSEYQIPAFQLTTHKINYTRLTTLIPPLILN